MVALPLIYVSLSDDRQKFVKKIFDLFHDEIAAKQRILVKPNIVSAEGYPTTTHPDMLEAVCSELRRIGKDFFVGDGPAVDVNSRAVLKKTALNEVCRKFELEIINFNKVGTERVKRAGDGWIAYSLCRIPLECDYVISLPVLKIHGRKKIGLTSALKNQFGYLSKAGRIACHLGLRNIHKAIAGINVLAKPDLFIVDAVEVLLGANEVRHGGRRERLGILYGGQDPVSLDCYGFRLLQEKGDAEITSRSPKDIPYIRLATELKIGSPDYQLREI